MDKIIARAIELVNRQLISPSPDSSANFILINIRNGLNQLLELNLSKNDQIRLFCRQINRLMDYNDSISYELWMEWHDDILCITNGPNSKQLKSDSWERFLDKMEFESQLEQCELQFQVTFGKRKTLNELFFEHNDFLLDYLQKCLCLHSKVQIQGLVGNIDDLLHKVYGITDVSLTSERREYLQKKLQYIEIDLDCSNKALQCYQINFPTNSNLNNFLPSTNQIEMSRSGNFEKIQDILQNERWFVILGDPGNAKTSLLRWITRIFSEKALRNDEKFLRIPVLIRIGEFAAWLDLHQTKTLIDYIGEHTWFSQPYCHDNGQIVLKEVIDHGHALILLDGLDEISDLGQREKLVNLVREFIDKYVRSPDFTSAFDNEKVRRHMNLHFPKTVETPLPTKSGGNQIVITSRFIGYQLYPLIGPFIKHYSLLSMEQKEAKEFVENWMILVEKNFVDILKNEKIPLNEGIIKNLPKKRFNSMESMFKTKSKLLMSNPALLSLICTAIFQSPDELHLESRVQLYNHTVQQSFSVWRMQQSNILESVLTNFLINLATYLHLHSQSGLMDKFDMICLCCLTLQQHGLPNNRTDANQLISLLELNSAFVGERGLHVFGFQHLSFQEYFVAQSLVRNSSIEEVAKCIRSFTINSCFHESLLLAVGWISFNWSFNDYDKFCQYLVTSTKDYSMPFGTLLLFDAFNDMNILPSNSVIITALNNLFNHHSNLIGSTYLFWNLSQLSDDIIIEWMQSSLKDEKSISKFCQCLETKRNKKSKGTRYDQKLPSVVYEQLWSFHNRSQAIEFDIDQVLRTALKRDGINNQIFNKDLSSYFLSHDICLSNIHPLILSVIIAVCGGLYYKLKDKMLKILFSTKQMHRESSIFVPIMEYFTDNKESHSIKIQILIDGYQNFLEKSSPSDISSVIVDTFIALICLQGLSQPSIYQKYENYQALPLALERFKWNWFHFIVSGESIQLGTTFSPNISFIQSELKTILDMFFSRSNQSDEQNQSFSLACATAWRRFNTIYMEDLLNLTNSRNNQVDQQKSHVLLTCLPQSLQKLYSCTIISSTNKTDSLPLVVFLLECLKQVNNIIGDDPVFPRALSILKPLLTEHSLQNYALAMFREKYFDIEWFIENPQRCDPFFVQKTFNWEALIDLERQGIYQDKSTMENEEKDLQLFAASISLARTFQAQHRSCQFHALKPIIILPSVESEDIYFAIMNILNPVLRIIIFSTILEMKDPLIFDEEQRDQLRDEMIGLLYSLLPELPVLTSTFLFIRCHQVRLFFPELFQEMSIIIGEKLNETSENKQSHEQEAAFIALKQLNNSDLSDYLSKFAKQTNNLSDLLHFNSTIFYRYFHDTTDFKSCNISLLAIMYLAELTFDVQNLQIYMNNDHKEYFSFVEVFQQLWNESSKGKRIMTFRIATWITKYLQELTKKVISYIISCISRCVSIEKRAIPVIKEWLNYKTNNELNAFAQYAALELIIDGSDIPDLIDIINEMFRTGHCFRIIFVADRLFDSPFVNSTIIRQIAVALQQNPRYASQVSVWISRKDILQLVLNLELEQLTSNAHQQDKISLRPFLLMINGYSEDLQVYLFEYLRTFTHEQLGIKEEYVAIIVKWIIERLIRNENLLIDLYEYIFTLLHDQRFPRIQKAIINAFDTVFDDVNRYKKDVFMQDNIISNLEKVIFCWDNYPIDVVAVCLLSYGNCLLRLQLLGKNSNVSNEMEKILIKIFEIFFPKTLSIRAGFCLVFTKVLNTKHEPILNWFKSKRNITSEMTFEILLQKTLYKTKNTFFGIEGITEHLNIYPESMNMFVINLYNYLCKKNPNEYIHDRVPDYIRIARYIDAKHSKKFCNAVQNSSFGEKEFKTKLYIHSKNYRIDRINSIHIYSLFDIVTVESLNMMESIEENTVVNFQNSLNNLKQVSDRKAIEKLFDLLNQKRYHPMLEEFLSILKCLVKANAISLLELHQNLPLIDDVSYESSSKWRHHEENIFDLLLDSSCFKNEKVSLRIQKTYTTKTDIDEAFDIQIAKLEKKLNLSLKKIRQ